MKVILKGVHVKLTPALKQYVGDHLVAPLERFYDNEAAELEVHLCDNNGPKGGMDKECRVSVRIPKAASVHVEETSDDLYKAICFSRDRLERVFKSRLSKRRRHSPHSSTKPSARVMGRLTRGRGGEDPSPMRRART